MSITATANTNVRGKTPLGLHSHEVIHEQLRQHMMSSVLPKIFPAFAADCKHHHAYPIVIGGSVIQKCAVMSSTAQAFVNDLFTEDIDVKLVITKDIESNDDPIITRLNKIRMRYMKLVVKKLQAYIKKDESIKESGWIINVDISDSLLHVKIEAVQRKRVYTVQLTYVSPDVSKSIVLPMMDVGLFSNYSTPTHFNQYRELNPSVKLPVPHFTKNHIQFTTCDYAYYDTVRMMVDRGKYFEQTKSMFALMKLSRYIVKFICLYVLLKSTKRVQSPTSVNPKLVQVYERAHTILKSVNMTRLSLGNDGIKKVRYDTPYVNQLQRLLEKVVRVADIKELVKVVGHVEDSEVSNKKTQQQVAGDRITKSKKSPVSKSPFDAIGDLIKH